MKEHWGVSTIGLRIVCAALAGMIPLSAAAQVAIVADGPSDLANSRVKALGSEVRQLTRDDPSSLELPSAPTHVGDFTIEGVKKQLKAALNDRSVKAIVGLGLLTGIAVAELGKAPKKPIVLPFAAPKLQGLPRAKNGTTGVRNLAYITGLFDFDSDMRRFREVIRDRKVAFVIDAHAWKVVKARRPADMKLPGDGRDDVVVVPIPPTADGALAALPKDAEAVYFIPHFRLPFSEMQRFVDALKTKGIASYSGAGPEWVEKGAFVTLVPADLDTERFRRAALYLRDGLSGEPLSTLPTAFPRRTELVINMATARALGIYPKFELMTEARLVGQDGKAEKMKLTLRAAIDEGLANNPAQRALREEREASKGARREARGNFLPQLSAEGSYAWIDPDIANTILNAERTLQWGATAQIAYSPLAVSGYIAQDDLVDAAERAVDAGRLDLILEVVQAYLSVLQAEAIERLRRDNLGRVRTNRGLAELRVEIGTSGRQDIARWDIELADGRAETIQASATRNQTEIDLNRTLAAPSERSFATVRPQRDAASLLIDKRAAPYIEDLYSFRIYRGFMAEEALRNSPELKQLDAQIEAQSNLITGNIRQLFIPTIGTSFGITHVLDRSGVGGDAEAERQAAAAAAMQNGGTSIGINRDDFTWQWGISLNFTLFDDIRYGTIERLRRTRAQLEAQRQDVANRVEQRVRSALHQAGASGAAVNLRKDAVAAARINLEAVTDAYRQGTETIITLIDAQNQALSTEINAANALYQYLSDYAAAERASGRFLILQSPQARDDFFVRLEAYAAQVRAEGQKEMAR